MEAAEEKVWAYLSEHKNPVLASTLAKRFTFSKSHVARILKEFESRGSVEVMQIGSNKFYKVKQ